MWNNCFGLGFVEVSLCGTAYSMGTVVMRLLLGFSLELFLTRIAIELGLD